MPAESGGSLKRHRENREACLRLEGGAPWIALELRQLALKVGAEDLTPKGLRRANEQRLQPATFQG